MSVGLGLLHKALENQETFSSLRENGIDEHVFRGDEKKVYEFVSDHLRNYGVYPQIETVEVECGVEFPEFPDEPIGYWIDRVKRRRKGDLIATAAQKMMDDVSDSEIEGACDKVRQLYVDLQRQSSEGNMAGLNELAVQALADHDRRQRESVISGIPFGFPYIDSVSDGAQPSDTVALIGRPGCLAGETQLYFARKGGKGSGRWYTVEDAYYKFNRIPRDGGRSGNQYLWNRSIPTKTQSLKEDGLTGLNDIVDIVYSGEKQLWRVTTETGKTVRVTIEHPFKVPFGTKGADCEGFKKLEQLKVGDLVVCKAPNMQGKGRGGRRQSKYEVSGVKYHPNAWKSHTDRSRIGKNYTQAERITFIEKSGIEPTYDLVMKSPYRNYVANGFVVHNTGKSYILIKCANNAHAMGLKPLFVSMEMNLVQVARRAIALKFGIPADRIRKGLLDYYARQMLETGVMSLEESSTPFYVMQGGIGFTVEDVIIRVQETRPDALYVDGAYLLAPGGVNEGRWERVTSTAEMLKTLATTLNIPVFETYQFNRKGPGSLGNIGWSDAIGQLASIVIGISEEGTEEANDAMEGTYSTSSYKLLDLLKGREGEKGTIRLQYDMRRMKIEQTEVLSGQESEEVE